jgi:hypothetical protein
MAGEKLYDYNTSFQVVRTNPKINGNFKVTVDSTAKVWLNSMDVNTVLSDKRYKKFEITGENPYAVDVYNFFKLGTTPTEVIFEAAQFTTGSRQSATEFGEQYDFFYASGASTLIDKNYTENFRYFAPLWIKDVIPDFFVVFKLPDPISYPYTTNVSVIESGKKYKLIQSPYSTDIFKVTYDVDLSGNPVEYSSGSYAKPVGASYQMRDDGEGGQYRALVPDVLEGLAAAGVADIPVVVGGIIPDADAAWLKSKGVAAIFTPKDYDATVIMRKVLQVILDSSAAHAG